MLVNTSFNVAGDPIVFDAIDCYVNMSRLGLPILSPIMGYTRGNPETRHAKDI